jgi:hypothetical protein
MLAVALSFWQTVGKPDCQDMDFGSYYRAGAAVSRGKTPYTVDEHGPLGAYPYAPAYAYLFMPLSYLPYLWACRLWMVVNWTATAAALVLALWLVRGPDGPADGAGPTVCLAGLATGAYLWANVRMGQVATVMVLGCLGWAVCRRRGAWFTGGLLLAAACAVKLAPGVFLPYLVFRRDLRGLAGVLVGAAALFLLPAAWVGWEGTVRLHREWVRHTAATQIPAQICRRGNQSLLAQLARLPGISDGDVCTSPENLAALARAYPLIVAGLAAALYACVLRMIGGPCSPEVGRWRENLVLVLLFIFLTLVHPRAWRCNFVALLLPCVLLAERARRRLPGSATGLVAMGLLALASAVPTIPAGNHEWTLPGWLLLGKHFWGAVAVAAACCRTTLFEVNRSRGRGAPGADAGGAAHFSSAWCAPECRRGTRQIGPASRPAG